MTPTEERAAIEAAWLERNPEIEQPTLPWASPDQRVREWLDACKKRLDAHHRFTAMLDAGAFLDAVLTMVPEGMESALMYKAWATVSNQFALHCLTFKPAKNGRYANHMAIALLAAIQKIGEQG